MIPFDFEYYRPDTLKEALAAFADAEERGIRPVYYGGGTELISMARAGSVRYGAVIDIKAIPELRANRLYGNRLILGAGLTLSEIIEANSFPLLGKCAGRVADHTMQCKITLGGNIASTIIYRETALAFMLADARIKCAGPLGVREFGFGEAFKRNMILPRNELIVSVSIENKYLQAPYFHIKKTKNEKIDYPLITAAALIADRKLRVAFSGLAPYPFRDTSAEKLLNDRSKSAQQRADAVCSLLSRLMHSDLCGSREYREFVLRNTLINMLNTKLQ